VRKLVKDILERMGFKVVTAVDGREGIEIFRQLADKIVCVMLDLTMPNMDGTEAFLKLREIRSDVRVILCSGYNEKEATHRFAGKGLSGFIQKPYNMDVVKQKLDEIL
jgi:two-component system, cell cycle sensor histidine kinase and response regulator CckA